MPAFILPLPPGEVPKGPAGVHLQSMSRCAPAHSEAGAGTGRYPLISSPTADKAVNKMSDL